MSWPERGRGAVLVLAGHAVFPAFAVLVPAVVPGRDAPDPTHPDWVPGNPAARAILLLWCLQVCYAFVLVAVMRGWRVWAAGFGALALGVSGLIHLFVWMAVTHLGLN